MPFQQDFTAYKIRTESESSKNSVSEKYGILDVGQGKIAHALEYGCARVYLMLTSLEREHMMLINYKDTFVS